MDENAGQRRVSKREVVMALDRIRGVDSVAAKIIEEYIEELRRAATFKVDPPLGSSEELGLAP